MTLMTLFVRAALIANCHFIRSGGTVYATLKLVIRASMPTDSLQRPPELTYHFDRAFSDAATQTELRINPAVLLQRQNLTPLPGTRGIFSVGRPKPHYSLGFCPRVNGGRLKDADGRDMLGHAVPFGRWLRQTTQFPALLHPETVLDHSQAVVRWPLRKIIENLLNDLPSVEEAWQPSGSRKCYFVTRGHIPQIE